jgi:hypothetical protein
MQADMMSMYWRTMEATKQPTRRSVRMLSGLPKQQAMQPVQQVPQVNEREVVDAVWGLVHAPSLTAFRVGEKLAASPSPLASLAGGGLIAWAVYAGLSALLDN